jgi:hypothetical protein
MEKVNLLGKLTMQEKVDPVVDSNKIPNTFVVSIPNPLKSYYTSYLHLEKPNSIVFVTKEPVSFEKILRATKKINTENGLQISGGKCEMHIGSSKYSGIRVRGLKHYSEIPVIQRLYGEEGFEFAKAEKLKEETDARIKVNKFFQTIKIEEGIYQSRGNSNRYYITIPRYLSWDAFKAVTRDIKNNISVTGFDVAKGLFYDNDGVTEMIRVIKPDITLDMIREIRNKYIDRLS